VRTRREVGRVVVRTSKVVVRTRRGGSEGKKGGSEDRESEWWYRGSKDNVGKLW